MPRFDSASVFGRLLDWDRGGFFALAPTGDHRSERRYLNDTLVLETTFVTDGGRARVVDCFAMRSGGRSRPYRQLLRVAEGLEGRVELSATLAVRFDYGSIPPWIRSEGAGLFSAIGGATALIVWSDMGLEPSGLHDLTGRVTLGAGDRARVSIQFAAPEQLDDAKPRAPSPADVEQHLDRTIEWWRKWTRPGRPDNDLDRAALRSAIVLKGLTNAPTGGIVAAPTTSLPETPGGSRNWDYRFCWIRDSGFTLRSLAELGFLREADGFRRFVERSAAGSAGELQVMYGVGGEHRLTEINLDELEGYRGARPVRIGNAAYEQTQLDVHGVLVQLSADRLERGGEIDADYWRFLSGVIDAAAVRWKEKDRGIWEVRGDPQHFVQSKVMCWVALDCGVKIAETSGLRGDVDRWRAARNEVRAAIEDLGYDRERGVFVRAFGASDLDAALLLLPEYGFVEWDDPRMVRTADAIWAELGSDGLLRRYLADDGLSGVEGRFLCCSFWLVECLARQGRHEEATEVYARACAGSNDLGLFAEQYDVTSGELLGNFPQGLTHLAHIQAALALAAGETPAELPSDDV
jgi:GH15 family glucan-1,4-alpha-glucosidase